MKSLYSIAATVLLLLNSVAYSQTLLSTSFEEYSNGSVFGQNNWAEDNDNDGFADIVTNANYAKTGTKGLKIYSNSALETIVDYQSYGKDETGLSGNVYLDFWVKLATAPSEDFYIRVFDHLPDNGIRRATELRWYPNGDIKISDGGSKRDVPTELYTMGDWVRVSFSVDYATFKYQTAINGTVLTNSNDGTEYFGFRESYDPVDKDRPSGIKEYHGLRFWYEAAIGDIAVDDIYIGTDAISDIAFTAPSSDRTITVTQPNNAIITLNPDQAIYQVGDVVTATLSDIATHYKFNSWTGSYAGIDNPLTINVSGNVTLGAEIIIDPNNPPNDYTITITQPEGGIITVDPATGPYYEGTTVEFSVTPAIGYSFDSWTGITGSSTKIEVVVNEDLNVSAIMVPGTFNRRTVHVSTTAELEDAMETMLPGDSIVLADGTYNEVNETVEYLGGTAEYPVYIIAANQGMAKITGKSRFTFENSAYITVRGLDIDVVEVNNIFKLEDSNNIRICYNTITRTGDAEGSSKWIYIGGLWDGDQCYSHHNRVDHNLIEGKFDRGALLVIDGTNGDVPQVSQYDRIDHNHFKTVSPRISHEKETIRVGWSQQSLSSAFCTIEYNLFEECDGDPEIISVKTNDNYVRNNTFLRSLGTVSLRHGNRTEISGNFFIGDGKTAEFEGNTIGCGGVRVYGKDHKIFNNYFEGLTGFRWDAACTLTQGDASNDNVDQDSDLTKHYVIENLEFTHNTLANNLSDIEIGYRDDWGKAPKNVLIANNIIIQDTNPVTKVHFAGTDDDVSFFDNIIYTTGTGTNGDISFSAAEAMNVNPLLEKTTCTIPEAGCESAYPNAIYKIASASSPAVDPSPTYTITEVTHDIEGQPGISSRDLGSDEYNGTAAITNGLLDARHVGPDAMPFSETSTTGYTILLTQSTGGVISVDPASGTYAAGTTVTFTAVPDEGYVFSGWNGINGSEATIETVINANLLVSGEFRLESVLSVEEPKVIAAFPNPIVNEVRLVSLQALRDVSLISMTGRDVAISTTKNHDGITIRLAEFVQRGTYLLRVETEQGDLIVYKIIKKQGCLVATPYQPLFFIT